MRIGEFLEFFADAFRLREPLRTAAIERALERAGLAERRKAFVEHLSLGWKQRLLLSKILLHEPKLLLLDEPATGLDPLARIQLREQLKRLHAEGVAILISSHILTDLEDICTRIVFIAEGKNVHEAQTRALASDAIAALARCELEFEGSDEALDRTMAGFAGSFELQFTASESGNSVRCERACLSFVDILSLGDEDDARADVLEIRKDVRGNENRNAFGVEAL